MIRCSALSGTRLTQLLEKQMAYERDTARTLRTLRARTRSTIPKLILKSIEFDTGKHAYMYSTLVQLATGKTVSEIEHRAVKENLEEHIRREKRMLLQAERISRRLDPRMKPLLDSILTDEKRHHQALSTLLEVLKLKEKISEEAWWNHLERIDIRIDEKAVERWSPK